VDQSVALELGELFGFVNCQDAVLYQKRDHFSLAPGNFDNWTDVTL